MSKVKRFQVLVEPAPGATPDEVARSRRAQVLVDKVLDMMAEENEAVPLPDVVVLNALNLLMAIAAHRARVPVADLCAALVDAVAGISQIPLKDYEAAVARRAGS